MSNPFAPEQWMKGWQDLQQKFASSWQDASGAAGASKVPLSQGFEMWSQLAGAGSSGNETFDRMVAGARQMVSMMQSVLDGAGGNRNMPGADWSSAIGSAFGGFDLQRNPVADALRQATGEGARGFEQLFAQFSEAAKPLNDAFSSNMHMPAFGYSREAQERRQQLALAMADQSKLLDAYNRLMLDASRRALEKLELKLAEHSEPGRQLKSFREVYDTWIDAAEAGYAEVALSADFRSTYGALVNAQMRVRQHVQQEIERSTGGVGMPTRSELDGVHRKLAELKRRVAELEHEKALAGVEPVAAREYATQTAPAPDTAKRKPVRKPAAAAASAAPIAARKPRKSAKRPKLRIVAGTDAAAASRAGKPKSIKAPAAVKPAAPKPAKAAKSQAGPTSRLRGESAGSFADRLAALRKTSRKNRKGAR